MAPANHGKYSICSAKTSIIAMRLSQFDMSRIRFKF
jgi:hypothetical protein